MTAKLKIEGEVFEIGIAENGICGLTIKAESGQKISITGLTMDQCRSIKDLAFEKATVTIAGVDRIEGAA